MAMKMGHEIEVPFAIRGQAFDRLLDLMSSVWPNAVCEYEMDYQDGDDDEQHFFHISGRRIFSGSCFAELFVYKDESAYQAWENNSGKSRTLIQFMMYDDRTVAIVSSDKRQISLIHNMMMLCAPIIADEGAENANDGF